ncbi:MAG: glycosyltransferase family 2 protein, partial [Candidatus Ornithospirochaeta sp.]
MAIVSVIVPAYNTSKYISKCLDSIINQTLRDIEIICVDDGSVDSTPLILDEYSRRDSRVKVIHVPNGGVSKARNIGLSIAQGEFIAFVDSDDTISPEMLEKMVETAENNESDIVQNALEEGEEDRALEGKEEIIYALMSGSVSKSVWSKLFNRRVLDSVYFPEGEVFAEDFMFSLKALEKARRVDLKKEVYYQYIDRSDSATKKEPNDKEMYFFSVLEYMGEVVKGNDRLEAYYRDLNTKETITFITRFIGHKDVSASSIESLQL